MKNYLLTFNTATNFRAMTVKELREICKQAGIKGYGHWTKEEMVKAIEDAFIEALKAEDAAKAEETKVEETKADEVPAVVEATEEAPKAEKNTKKNGWEKIAMEQLRNTFNFIIGGLENAVQDGDMTEEAFKEEAAGYIDYIYDEAITTHYEPGFCGGKAPKEMRFATKQFCIDYIKKLYKEDGLEYNEPEESKKTTKTTKATVKVVLLAFTGMKIGEYSAELKDGEYIVVVKNGTELKFDTNGKQLNAKNPKFGNKIKALA